MALTQQPKERARASSTIRVRVLGVFAAVLLASYAALASRAEGFVYWTNGELGIGRAALDGTNVDRDFIAAAKFPLGLAVNARHIYWAINFRQIGRADLAGAKVDTRFLTGVDGVDGVAVDTRHIYWTHSGAIGRAKLDGTGVQESFILSDDPGGLRLGPAVDVAVDARYVYWTQGFTIARANLDGTDVDQNFITEPDTPVGLALDASHIYWTDYYAGTIGRASLDGTNVEGDFIRGRARAYVTDVVVDADHLYWGQFLSEPRVFAYDGTIGRASLDGTEVDQRLVSVGDRVPESLAADALTDRRPAGKASAARTQRQRGNRIVVRVKVKAKERLTARATGKIQVNPTYRLKPQRVTLATSETKKLKLKPKRAKAQRIARALKRGEKATVRLNVELTGVGGNRETEKLRVRLHR
jgi:virginiamycin B lyase